MGFSRTVVDLDLPYIQERVQIALAELWEYCLFVWRFVLTLSEFLQAYLVKFRDEILPSLAEISPTTIGLQVKEFVVNWQTISPQHIAISLLFIFIIALSASQLASKPKKKKPSLSQLSILAMDLAKSSYETMIARKLKKVLQGYPLDINVIHPSSGLSIFLCACLAANRDVINWLLSEGADVNVTTEDGDSALYLATFGLLNSQSPDLNILSDLVHAGCDVNQQNRAGFTPLHRAASKGQLPVIEYLKRLGADVYITNNNGIYPLDSAVNAGHVEAAESLKISLRNTSLWEIVEPHTPVSVRLGLQSPRTKHLAESTFIRKRLQFTSCQLTR